MSTPVGTIITIETSAGPDTATYCNRPDCRTHALRVGRAYGEPVAVLTDERADALARERRQPVECFRCGNYITAIVDGPDPRD